jgi:uracil-DNA glycosylase
VRWRPRSQPGWRAALGPHLDTASFAALESFVHAEWRRGTVFPPAGCIFEAMNACPLSDTRVVIVGQDPYHGRNQACGLAFSVSPGVAVPSSLRNILRELRDDLGIDTPAERGGDLRRWAASGVLLLNTVLTVREGEANSHAGRGWEEATDAAISAVARERDGLVFVLWGRHAAAKAALVPPGRGHVTLTSAHPSGLSAHRGFFGSRPFSQANAALVARGAAPVDWRL